MLHYSLFYVMTFHDMLSVEIFGVDWNDGFAGNFLAELIGVVLGIIVTFLIVNRIIDRRYQREWQPVWESLARPLSNLATNGIIAADIALEIEPVGKYDDDKSRRVCKELRSRLSPLENGSVLLAKLPDDDFIHLIHSVWSVSSHIISVVEPYRELLSRNPKIYGAVATLQSVPPFFEEHFDIYLTNTKLPLPEGAEFNPMAEFVGRTAVEALLQFIVIFEEATSA